MAEQKQVITVTAFLHKEGKMFIAKRAATKKFLPNVWEMPGGHVDYGESCEDALKREFQEEFSVEIVVEEPYFVFTYLRDDKPAHAVEIVYFAKLADESQEIELHEDDHSEYRWISASQVTTGIKDPADKELEAMKRGFDILKSHE